MMLVNGSQGTGTGHASLIMNYHPLQVRDAVVKVLKGKKLKPGTLVPWFKGFSGTVERNQETGQVVITGSYEIVNSTTIKITEIPIGTYLDQYKEILNKLEDEDLIKGYEDRSNETAFDFTITVPRTTTALPHDEIMKRFKLISRDTENFTLWSEDGDLRRYASAEDVIEAFTAWRLTVYDKRLEQLRAETVETIRWLSEKLRFILFYLDNVDSFKNQKKDALIALLLKHDFIDYDRLLAMQIWTLTRDKIEELKKLIDEARKEKARLDADTAPAVYERELKELTYEE
jgi:DNA topoisomerase-2